MVVKKELGLNNDIINMNGGVIVFGYLLVVFGTRIIGYFAYEL